LKRNPKIASSPFAAYIELTKPRITYLILVSTALGYYLGADGIDDIWKFIMCLLGSSFVSSGSGALNHFMEVSSDALMDRTRFRPLPSGLIKPNSARLFGLILILIGVLILLYFTNLLTATLAVITVILYILIYTPLKKITWLNTSIGAIPGAIPPLGGWTAATGELNPESWILFGILYFWQHPHFYAIAFMFKRDYAKAGYQMLPVLDIKGKRTNRQIIWHSLMLIPISLMPSYIGLLGPIYFWSALTLGLIYFFSGFPLIKSYSLNNAKLLLKVSVFYLPLLFCFIIIDKII
jgi:heme o synthase